MYQCVANYDYLWLSAQSLITPTLIPCSFEKRKCAKRASIPLARSTHLQPHALPHYFLSYILTVTRSPSRVVRRNGSFSLIMACKGLLQNSLGGGKEIRAQKGSGPLHDAVKIPPGMSAVLPFSHAIKITFQPFQKLLRYSFRAVVVVNGCCLPEVQQSAFKTQILQDGMSSLWLAQFLPT